MSFLTPLRRVSLLPPLLAMSGCGVYAPLTPPTPLVTRENPVEVSGGFSLHGWHATAAVAPVSHLTLMASTITAQRDGLFHNNPRGRARHVLFSQRQSEVAIGFHASWLGRKDQTFTMLYGLGRAHTLRTYDDLPTLSATTTTVQMAYRKQFVQLQFLDTRCQPWLFGGAFRLTRLTVDEITARESFRGQAIPGLSPHQVSQLRADLLATIGVRHGAWRAQLSTGTSLPLTLPRTSLHSQLNPYSFLTSLSLSCSLSTLFRKPAPSASSAP